MQQFEVPGITNYTALLLSPDGGTLYLGAREMLLAVNTSHFQAGAQALRVSPREGLRSPQGRTGAPQQCSGSVEATVHSGLVGSARRWLPRLSGAQPAAASLAGWGWGGYQCWGR